jgi:hypothetical protein
MKTIVFLIIIALAVIGCGKKVIKPTPTVINKLQISVSGLSSKTSITLLLRDGNLDTIFSAVNHFGDTTYTITTVKPGQYILFHDNSNLEQNATTGDGIGTIKLIFNGTSIETFGGGLGTPLNQTQYNIQLPGTGN